MTRASRIVLIASLLLMSMTVVGVSPASAGVPTITSVSGMETSFGCARMSDGTARCSGLNTTGQLGDGTFNNSLLPVVVKNPGGTGALTGVVQVVAGNTWACARLTTGGVDCWGDNANGQLGNGTVKSSLLPVAVKSTSGGGALTHVAQLALGKYHSCARLVNGTVDCWGHNGYYELGDGTNVQRLFPHGVRSTTGAGSLTGVTSIAVTQYNSCASLADGSARCWGLNQFGVLGDGTTKFKPRPTKVRAISGAGFLANVKQIVTAPNHTCALLKNGTVNCWGQNAFGQLGDGTKTTRLRPVVVKNSLGTAALINVTQIAAGGGFGGDHTCALQSTKNVACRGANSFGQLGDATRISRLRPVVMKAPSGNAKLPNVLSITVGPLATCVVVTPPGAKCMGFNSAGQFGNGSAEDATRPVGSRP